MFTTTVWEIILLFSFVFSFTYIWLTKPVPNQYNHSSTIQLILSVVLTFPDLRTNLGQYNVIITNRTDDQNYKNKPQVVITQNYPFELLSERERNQ